MAENTKAAGASSLRLLGFQLFSLFVVCLALWLTLIVSAFFVKVIDERGKGENSGVTTFFPKLASAVFSKACKCTCP